jgi:hypothetical protein
MKIGPDFDVRSWCEVSVANHFRLSSVMNKCCPCVPIGLILVICRVLGSVVLPTYDDAFITFRYARNLAIGEGFLYNPHEWVLGTTSPLFGLMCSVFYWFKLPMPASAVIVNIVAELLLIYVTASAIARESRKAFVLVCGSLLALSPIMTRVSVGAMEMNVFLLGSVLAIVMYTRGAKTLALFLGAVLYFVRPEGLMLVSLFLFREIIHGNGRAAIGLGAVALCALIPPLVLINHVYGHVLPQSVLSKSESSGSLMSVLKQFFVPDPLGAILLVPALLGIVVASKSGGILRILVPWILLYVGAYVLSRPKMWSWYGAPVYYAVIVFGSVWIVSLFEKWRTRLQIRFTVALAILLVLLPCLAWSLVLGARGPSSVTKNIYEPLEAWCKGHVRQGDLILASDIGAIGYYSNARICDAAGLVTPGISSRSMDDLITEYVPDFVFLTATKKSIELLNSSPYRVTYQPEVRFSITGDRTVDLQSDQYNEEWTQDYLVFRRIE